MINVRERLSILRNDQWMPFNFKVLPEAINRAAEYFNSEISPDGRLQLYWFGFIDVTAFPYIHHEMMGRILCSVPGVKENPYFFLKPGLGWLWTSSNTYPNVCIMKETKWILAEDLVKTDF